MKTNIDSIIRRTQSYWYSDGLTEIASGLFLVVMCGYFLLQARIKTFSIDPILANIGLLAVIVLVLWVFRSALQAVKVHLTYPRTGYVANPGTQKGLRWQRYGLLSVLVMICILLAVLVLRSRTVPSWLSLLTGVVLGLTALTVSYRFRLLRFIFLACAFVLIGAAVSFINPGETPALALSSAAEGVCLIISGGVTLGHYLLTTQSPAEADL